MLDHGQLGPATPAVRTPAISRRPSALSSQRPSMSQARPNISAITESHPRRPSLLSVGESLSMSAIDAEGDSQRVRKVSGGERPPLRNLPFILHSLGDPRLSMSALDDSSDDDDEDAPTLTDTNGRSYGPNTTRMSDEAARIIGRRMSDAMLSTLELSKDSSSEKGVDQQDHSDDPTLASECPPLTHLVSPADLAAQLQANPKLAALRSPMAMTPLQSTSRSGSGSPISSPILVNPKCSGYFVEPMNWMKPFLESGQMAGKIVCPNSKCGAKLGNFDWAGVCCGCKQWVTPGFCISRSKVDEVTVL